MILLTVRLNQLIDTCIIHMYNVDPLTPAIYGAPLIKSTSTNEDCTSKLL